MEREKTYIIALVSSSYFMTISSEISWSVELYYYKCFRIPHLHSTPPVHLILLSKLSTAFNGWSFVKLMFSHLIFDVLLVFISNFIRCVCCLSSVIHFIFTSILHDSPSKREEKKNGWKVKEKSPKNMYTTVNRISSNNPSCNIRPQKLYALFIKLIQLNRMRASVECVCVSKQKGPCKYEHKQWTYWDWMGKY